MDEFLERNNNNPKANKPIEVSAPKIKVNKLIFDEPLGIKNPITAEAKIILDKSIKYEESDLICASLNRILL